jgi:hypothetical protein
MNSKEKAIVDRIVHLEDAIARGREFLESGKHAEWHGFQPMFVDKIRDGFRLPPHTDWVRNVFLPRRKKQLKMAHAALERVTSTGKRLANQSSQATVARRRDCGRSRTT